MMTESWQGAQVVIVGAARQGLALADFLAKRGTKVIVTDRKDSIDMLASGKLEMQDQIEWVLGRHPLSLLDGTDVLAVSGGVPLTIPVVQEAIRQGVPLTNDSQVFLDLVPCPTIGITGSAGKTTTTLLVGHMARAEKGDQQVWVGGNIGNPLISVIDQMGSDDLAVVELSSFQLELMTTAPNLACVLNITPNHLDRHLTMDAYQAAKSRILTNQGAADTAVLNREDPGSWRLNSLVQGELITFGLQQPRGETPGTYLHQNQIAFWDGEKSRDLFSREIIQLRGEHNLQNVLAACAVGLGAGFSDQALEQGVRSLQGVEHRLEYVRTFKGADWYNDSIATAPERTIAALNSFQRPIMLLAGGRDKDLPWDEFVQQVLKKVRCLVLFGETAGMIEKQVAEASREQGLNLEIHRVESLQDAVAAAADLCQPEDIVLLSPGGTSFDEFKDFAERGEKFKKWVKELN
jgi:UDP-N-acetylmuramoylalanine--D-glutamate ligase